VVGVAPRRALAGSLLLAVAAGALLLRGPALGDDREAPAAPGPEYALGGTEITGTPLEPVEPFVLSYVTDDDTQGFVACRPAAAFRRSGMGGYRTMLNGWIGQQWALAANKLKFDPTRPGQKPLRVDLFEQITANVRVWRTNGPKPNGRLALGRFTVRTTEPVDWVALCRLFQLKVTEVRDGDRVYYRLKDSPFGPDGFFYCPDGRTLVVTGDELPVDSERRLLKHLRRATPPPAPVFAQGKDWDRSLRGLLLVALDNRGGRLSKVLKDDEPDDGDIDPSPLFEHVDFWTFRFDDRDDIEFRGVGTCPDAAACESTARAITTILDAVRQEAEPMPDRPHRHPLDAQAHRMAIGFFEKLRVERDGRSVVLRMSGLGTIAEFASLVAAGAVN
jgi:hypothetical protein